MKMFWLVLDGCTDGGPVRAREYAQTQKQPLIVFPVSVQGWNRTAPFPGQMA